LSIILPAVLGARAAARRMGCANNLHQIGTALTQFESTHGHFPGSFAGGTASTVVPRREWSYSPSSLIAAELSGPSLAEQVPTIPDLDAPWNPDWNEIDLDSPNVLRCPDDSLAIGRASNYRYCRGVLPLWPKDPGGVFIHFRAIRAAEITDGLSTTAFASERLVSSPSPGRPDRKRDLMVFDEHDTPDVTAACIAANQGDQADAWWWNTEPVGNNWLSGRWIHSAYYHLFPPNSDWVDCRTGDMLAMGVTTARSYHPGGVNTLFGDGHATFVRDGITLPIWRAWATRAGHELASGE
jgi:prepilin-type processing-associated H-X9-DG protein